MQSRYSMVLSEPQWYEDTAALGRPFQDTWATSRGAGEASLGGRGESELPLPKGTVCLV